MSDLHPDLPFSGLTHSYYHSIDSTNEEAKRICQSVSLPHLVLAETQTRGKGRLGRTWHSPEGDGIWMTLIAQNSRPPEELYAHTFAASLAVATCIERAVSLRPQLKWPNDILIKGRKCCGILIETAGGVVLYGIGINVNMPALPPDLSATATSLQIETGRQIARRPLIEKILSDLRSQHERNAAEILSDWRSTADISGKHLHIWTDQEEIDGIAIGIADDGGLIVDTKQGRKTYYSADVRVREFSDSGSSSSGDKQ